MLNPSLAANSLLAACVRVFSVASSWVADNANRAPLDICESIEIVIDQIVYGIQIKRINGEVTPSGVLIERAVDIVTYQ